MLQPRSRKWGHLILLAAAELLAVALWFAASAVTPQLTAEWGLSGTQQAWLTMGVQLGFVGGRWSVPRSTWPIASTAAICSPAVPSWGR